MHDGLADAMRRLMFSVAITGISRGLMLRDRLLGRVRRVEDVAGAGVSVARVTIPSGVNVLDGRVMQPEGRATMGAVVICHGIGETVDHWLGAQRMLAEDGVASLVFNYSGFGRSTGWVGAQQCERDAVAAFGMMRRLGGMEAVSLLGYSLGSGIATAVAEEVGAERLVLCAVYPSMREAACRAGLPRMLREMVPDIWNTKATLRAGAGPVLIVHGEDDRLFPARMAREVAEAGGQRCALRVVPGVSHNDPIFRAESAYWRPVAEWIRRQD